MTVGLSTYAFFWQLSNRVDKPFTLFDVVDQTARHGVELLQICDYPAIEDFTLKQLKELRAAADATGVRLELGTRGLRPAHLRRYLDIADTLGAPLLRSMVNSPDSHPTLEEAAHYLQEITPELVDRGVTLALETYEQIPTAALVDLVDRAQSPRVGICLDPANAVAALEHPRNVVESTAPHVVNIHVKDFDFTRSEGWVGFALTGAPLGHGLLDYKHLIDTVDPHSRAINQVIEHWLPWQGTAEDTCRREREWTADNLNYLQQRQWAKTRA